MTTKIGFIGLGAMGLPMAKCVAAAGFPIYTAVHRNPKPAAEIEAAGATLLKSVADVARTSDVVITILPADAELEETAEILQQNMAPGTTLIEMTSGKNSVMQRIADGLVGKGIRVLDAPVSGGTTGAEKGNLTIMVGGEQNLLEEHRPLLESMGSSILHVGAIGQGKVVKIVNQAMAAIHLIAIGECFALGLKNGANAQTLYDVIKTSSGYSRMMDLRLPEFLMAGKFEPGFKLDLMKKDVGLAQSLAEEIGVKASLSQLVVEIFNRASAAGHGEEDFAAAAAHHAQSFGADLNQSSTE